MQSLSLGHNDNEAVHDSEARFRATFENGAVGVARVGPDGRWLEVNQRLCDIVGYTREEMLTKTFADITHPDDLPQDLKEARRVWAGEIETYLREKRYHRKNGSVAWVKLTVSVVRKTDGSPDYFISVIEDISAQRRAEETLRASEEQFRILADTAPVMIWASGPDRLCNFFNKPWLDFTGRPMEKELGNGWMEGVHPEDYTHCMDTYGRYFEAHEPFDMEYRLRRFDGRYRWLLDHGVPRFSSAGDFLGYIGSCLDITERKQAEAERDQLARAQVARAAAEAANQSKDEFLAMVSHELRSPLNAILGFSRILRSGRRDAETIDKAVAVIERSAKAQLRIIEDLLDSARIITGKLRIELGPIDLVPVLEAAPAASDLESPLEQHQVHAGRRTRGVEDARSGGSHSHHGLRHRQRH
jgi:PAS domain S-box-containing protein